MLIQSQQHSSASLYYALSQLVIPRPIAWVLTANNNASYNLAPFSFFSAITSKPPLLMLSVGLRPNGELKDTRVNITERQSMVVHIPSVRQLDAVSESSRDFASGISEVDALGLALYQEPDWPLPRLADSQVAFYCELFKTDAITASQLVIYAEIKYIFIDNEITQLDDKGRLNVDAGGLNPLARLGANEYASIGEIIHKPRPKE